MFTCPNCQTVLNKKQTKSCIVWDCPSCNGRAVTIEALRKTIPDLVVNKLWQRARTGPFMQKRKCPSCTRPINEVAIINAEKTEYIDVCPSCHIVWFDVNEYQILPKKSVEKEEKLSPKAREALAMANLELIKHKQDAKDKLGFSHPDEWWELIPAFLGLPVEHDEVGITHMPVITWLLSALIVMVNIVAFFVFDPEKIINNWGLIPADFARHYGLTFISAFFLHGGAFHLLGNLYFLIIFGDNVEDFLGKKQYLLLIFLAAATGAVVHIIGQPHSEIPCIGASGGISGVITYYALRFPQNRVGFLYFFRWVRIPVIIMFLLWVLTQAFGVYEQIAGFSNVSALAHLGGAAVGLVFWIISRPWAPAD